MSQSKLKTAPRLIILSILSESTCSLNNSQIFSDALAPKPIRGTCADSDFYKVGSANLKSSRCCCSKIAVIAGQRGSTPLVIQGRYVTQGEKVIHF